MQTSRTTDSTKRPARTKRQTWLTVSRIATLTLLLAITAGIGVLLFRPEPISVTQASKVEGAAALLQNVGFNDPIYLGITPGVEGEYPTFQVTAIGGKTIKVWIRTTPNGGWEIQLIDVFNTVASADGLARLAQDAVYKWEHMPADIKPRTDGSYGEYESRKYNYDRLAQYNPDRSYWEIRPNETADWPRK